MRASPGRLRCKAIKPTSATVDAINVLLAISAAATRCCLSTNKVAKVPPMHAKKARPAVCGSTVNAPAPTPWKRLASAPKSPPNTTNKKEAKVAIAPALPPYPDAIGAVERASSLATTKKARPHKMERRMVSVAGRPDALSLNPKAEVIPPKVPPYSAGKKALGKRFVVRVTNSWPHTRAVARADAIPGARPNAVRFKVVKHPEKAPANAAIGA